MVIYFFKKIINFDKNKQFNNLSTLNNQINYTYKITLLL